MATFDKNSWYQIMSQWSGGKANVAVQGTGLYDNGQRGAVFVKGANATNEQKWQIYSLDSGYYVFRTAASGSTGFLCTGTIKDDNGIKGDTVPMMAASSLQDDSFFWSLQQWSDGTYQFMNKANGTYRLHMRENALMNMTTRGDDDGDQKWFFSKLDSTIDNTKFSILDLKTPSATASSASATSSTASTTATSAPSSTITSAPTSNPTTTSATESSSSSSSSGLSTGASAAIGATIGGVLIIALGILIWLLHRRKKQRAALQQANRASEPPSYAPYYAPQEQKPAHGEYYPVHDNFAPVELPTERAPAELSQVTVMPTKALGPAEADSGSPR